MIPTVVHGAILTTIEMVKVKGMEVINRAMFQFVFLVIEIKEVKACEPFVSQFQQDQCHFQDIHLLRK